MRRDDSWRQPRELLRVDRIRHPIEAGTRPTTCRRRPAFLKKAAGCDASLRYRTRAYLWIVIRVECMESLRACMCCCERSTSSMAVSNSVNSSVI